MTRAYAHGPQLLAAGGVRFRLWAPGVERVELVLGDAAPRAMRAAADGWFALEAQDAAPGARYRFRLPDGMMVPDPASRFQPDDVHGPSEVVDPGAYAWRDGGWRGRPWAEAVVYELHVGTFTDAGTFEAAIERLPHLAALGVTAIELMPVGDFPGTRNWGYDGVLPYAPDSAYGRPEQLKALIDAAHAHGLMVLLDVVYNHFGPDGNYLPVYAPPIFTERHKTPWGAAVNFDGADSAPVRDFVIENALYWLGEFHLDGLRLDAVHAIVDDSPRPILQELAERVRAEDFGRPIHLVLENEHNEARWLARDPQGKPRLYTAQWNDDVHHVLHVAATGEGSGYYADYLDDTEKLGRALAEGFAFQGETMLYRGSARGEPSGRLPPQAFVAFIQNHDQVGNRAFGDRLSTQAAPDALRAISAVYLLCPQIPMLFMGEEWGCEQPFPFFCDFEGELGEAVRKGRREEFARFPEFQDPASRARIPDPQAEATFRSAKLRWDEAAKPAHAAVLDWHRRILDCRRAHVAAFAAGLRRAGAYEVIGPRAVAVRWRLEDGRELSLAANLSGQALPAFRAPLDGAIWREGEVGDNGALGPWSVLWRVSRPEGDAP